MKKSVKRKYGTKTGKQIISLLFEVLVQILVSSSRFFIFFTSPCLSRVQQVYTYTHAEKKKNVHTRNHSRTTVFLHFEHTAKSERAPTLYITNSICYCLLKNHSRATVFLHFEHTAKIKKRYTRRKSLRHHSVFALGANR